MKHHKYDAARQVWRVEWTEYHSAVVSDMLTENEAIEDAHDIEPEDTLLNCGPDRAVRMVEASDD